MNSHDAVIQSTRIEFWTKVGARNIKTKLIELASEFLLVGELRALLGRVLLPQGEADLADHGALEAEKANRQVPSVRFG